jgi:hypothetical protein
VTRDELIAALHLAPPDATPVDENDLEIIAVHVSADRATVVLWAEQK